LPEWYKPGVGGPVAQIKVRLLGVQVVEQLPSGVAQTEKRAAVASLEKTSVRSDAQALGLGRRSTGKAADQQRDDCQRPAAWACGQRVSVRFF